MQLRDTVIATITAQPDIHRMKLLETLDGACSWPELKVCLRDLRYEGVVQVENGRYRITPEPEPAPPPPEPRYKQSGFIAPIARARLMAGR